MYTNIQLKEGILCGPSVGVYFTVFLGAADGAGHRLRGQDTVGVKAKVPGIASLRDAICLQRFFLPT